MITVYEVKSNGFLGRTKEIDPKEGVGYGWVYDVPPAPICKWENSQWVTYEVEPTNTGFIADTEILATQYRKERDALLASSDFTQLVDAPFSDEQKQAWAEYRQALRDLTKQEGFPVTCVFPTQPL